MSNGGHTTVQALSVTDAYDMYQKHSEGAHKLWAYYSVVSLAVLGYTIGTDKNEWASLTFIVIGLSYFLFAFGNRRLLVESQREVERFALLFNSLASAVPEMSVPGRGFVSVTAVDPKTANLFHWGITVLVLLAILLTWGQKVGWG